MLAETGMILWRWVFSGLVLGLWLGVGAATVAGSRPAPAPHPHLAGATSGPVRLRGILGGRWLPGPCVGELGGGAVIRVPVGFALLEGDQVRRYLIGTRQRVTGREGALVVRSGAGWFVSFAFEEVGRVSEDDRERLDPESLLVAVRRMTGLVNRDRQRQGWSPIQVLGWAAAPDYDEKRHRLEWATDEMSSGRSLFEMNARFLGRRGVMSSKLVTDPTQLSRTLPDYRRLMEGFEFKPGQRYEDFQAGDRVAGYGLSALVVDGTASVAVRTGLLMWPWWVGIAGILLVGLALLRVDPRKKATRPRSRARVGR